MTFLEREVDEILAEVRPTLFAFQRRRRRRKKKIGDPVYDDKAQQAAQIAIRRAANLRSGPLDKHYDYGPDK